MTTSDDALARPACVPEHPDVAQTIAYRRSLRASRTRRAATAIRRRRILRSRGSMLAAAAGLLFASGGAVAAQHSVSGEQRGITSATVAAAQAALGVPADGVVGPVTRAATKRFQRSKGLTVDGVIGARTLSALGVAVKLVDKGVRAAAASVADPVLARIAVCESGGDPTAVSADGRYHGKYQFSRATWRAMGGTGNPARAAEAEQDRIAAKLLAQAGTSPWPNCA
jgi:peptidoglycan hydrolase-like protein with peptidoglycan-binding domain